MTAIQRATVEDARDLSIAHIASWQKGYRGLYSDELLDNLSVDESIPRWEKRLRSDDTTFLTRRNRQVAGFITVRAAPAEDTGELYLLYVNPDFWRQGVGRRLSNFSCNWFMEQGYKRAIVWVNHLNKPGMEFYEACGWEPDSGRQTSEIYGIKVPEVRYSRML